MGWEILIASDAPYVCGLASWCVAVGPILMGLRKLRPHVELQSRSWDSARALATEQKRNVQLDLAMTRR